MAVQNLIEQHVIFITSTSNIDGTAILANTLVQALATNSVGNDLILSYEYFFNWNGTVWSPRTFLDIKCYISTAFQATVQANIPALQTAFPQYTIVTWGNATSFGN